MEEDESDIHLYNGVCRVCSNESIVNEDRRCLECYMNGPVSDPIKTTTFESELAELINKHSLENGSDTPDFLLAEYLANCLEVYHTAVVAREVWYGRRTSPPLGFGID